MVSPQCGEHCDPRAKPPLPAPVGYAPRPPACAARYCTKQHEFKSSPREAIETGTYEMHEAAAGVTQCPVLQQKTVNK